jgi:hypothetical protein
MSRTFTDENLLTWEAFASAGSSGLATGPRVVFHCISDPLRRPRYVAQGGDEADAEGAVHTMPVDDLRAMLRASAELE